MDAIMSNVRRSVARITIQWKKPQPEQETKNEGSKKKGTTVKYEIKKIVIPGLIVSTGVVATKGDRHESVIVIVDSTFFTKPVGPQCSKIVVELPVEGGGYKPIDPDHYNDVGYPLIENTYLCALKLKKVPRYIKGYIAPPPMFETVPVAQGENVYSFVFPNEDDSTATACCPGSTIDAYGQLVIHCCHVHEYAHFGSPLLNASGNIVGISSGSQGQTQAWSVDFLQKFFENSDFEILTLTQNITYSRNGVLIAGHV